MRRARGERELNTSVQSWPVPGFSCHRIANDNRPKRRWNARFDVLVLIVSYGILAALLMGGASHFM
jgi:hypothetical protein